MYTLKLQAAHDLIFNKFQNHIQKQISIFNTIVLHF